MELGSKQSRRNYNAAIIGFFLIIFVAAAFFLRSYFLSGKNQNQLESSSAEQNQNIQKYKSITAGDLLKKINSNEKITIIDIRDSESFEYEHILDSINISVSDLEAALPAFKKNEEYFIVDDLGLTPKEIQVMQIFVDNRFERSAYLEGGFFDWKNQLSPTVSFGDSYSFIDQSKVINITSDELKKALAAETDLYILDLRAKNEFDKAHIKNAVNIDLGDLESRRHEIPFGKKIILCDNDGLLAFQGAVRLFDMGIFNVYALSDGLNAWKEKGFELNR